MILKNFTSEDYQNLEELRRALDWNFWTEGGPVDDVRGIIAEVERRGDEALLEFTESLDGVDLRKKGLRVSRNDI
jgi:histidinol dehydrogenase